MPSAKHADAIAPEDAELARKAAEESFVLLKNDGGVLPLKANGKTIALIGPLADDAGQMLGSWAAKGDAKDVVTLALGADQAGGSRSGTHDLRQGYRYSDNVRSKDSPTLSQLQRSLTLWYLRWAKTQFG